MCYVNWEKNGKPLLRLSDRPLWLSRAHRRPFFCLYRHLDDLTQQYPPDLHHPRVPINGFVDPRKPLPVHARRFTQSPSRYSAMPHLDIFQNALKTYLFNEQTGVSNSWAISSLSAALLYVLFIYWECSAEQRLKSVAWCVPRRR